MKMFFATDIHGSEICWRKFLNAAAFYKADLVVLGGDVTGKVMVPIVAYPGYWEVTIRGERRRLETREELDALSASGEGGITQRFNAEMTRSLDRWLDMADGKLRGGAIPCVLNGGNDDIFEIDPILEAAPSVTFAEGKVIDLGGFTMVSMGWTNPTPWDTHREAPEDQLAAKIDAIVGQVPGVNMDRTIFNFHAPPYGTGLDEAPALDARMRPKHGGAVLEPVGSTAVRESILHYQPMLSVHGHIHESRGVAKLGRTLTVNPGSSYGDGVLQAALIDMNPKNGKVKYVLVNG
jgi:Icc-related predicted phosphoesterase